MSETTPEGLTKQLFIYVVLGAIAFVVGIAVLMTTMNGDTTLSAPTPAPTASR
jgi:hypothetical protein